MTVLTMHALAPGDLGALAAMLAESGLPVADLAEPDRSFFRYEHDGPAGYGGIEAAGPDCLLRSLVIDPRRRGEGLGVRAVELLEQHARAMGAERLHLLTTTAEAFFAARGYRLADRAAAPASIARSTEFTSLCPASARYMVKSLAGRS